MADVGFDSEKHALTRGDIERGGESLGDSSQALGRMIEAQKPEYWSEEGGFQAMRSALLSYLEAEDDILRRQKKRFVKFQGNVDTAAEAFTAAEAGNQEELARILATMEQAQGGAPSAPTPAPSPITGATPPASATQAPPGGPSATPPAGASGAPSGAAPGTAPVQNLPSDI